MVVRILDHVASYATYADGEVIYRLLATEIRGRRDVALSFDGIKAISSSFVNSALVRLLEEFSFDDIRRHLRIIDSTRQINRLVKDRFEFAAENEQMLALPSGGYRLQPAQ